MLIAGMNESSDPTMNLAYRLLMGKHTAVAVFERN